MVKSYQVIVFLLIFFIRLNGSEILQKAKEDLIYYAAEKNDFKLAQECIENGVGDINYTKFGNSFTPLMVACKNLNLELIKLLLDNGASVEVIDFFEEHALFYILWDLKSKYEKSDNKDSFVLKLKKIILLFLDRGININCVNKFGETLLIRSVKKSLPVEFIAILLECGANPLLKDKLSKMAIDYAREQRIRKRLSANNKWSSCVIL